MQVLGFDVGGANIKASDADGQTESVAFPMWEQADQLSETLRSIGQALCPQPDMIAATMTAELADCFENKAAGVDFVIAAIEQAFPETPTRIWLTSGEFAEPADARELPMLVAAGNWHALGTWAGRAVPQGPAVLVDVGSTTTDIIPLLDGFPVPQGLNDVERLLSGELVYTGSYRTPVCAVVSSVPFRNKQCPIAAEVFATMADVLLITGIHSEKADNCDTADGRPLTRQHSLNRLAHMICCDRTEVSEEDLVTIAAYIANQQCQSICGSLREVLLSLKIASQHAESQQDGRGEPVIIFSGSGAAVAQEAADLLGASNFSDRMFLPEMFVRPISEAACAFAVARLAHDRCRDDLLKVSEF